MTLLPEQYLAPITPVEVELSASYKVTCKLNYKLQKEATAVSKSRQT